MKYTVTISILILFMTGCATVSEKGEINTVKKDEPAESVVSVTSARPEPADQESDSDEPVVLGRIFAKTDFYGVIRASYVKLSIVKAVDKEKVYQLIIGDKEAQRTFPWYVQEVEPGYFFIDLPAGKYKITSITIPVGTTSATEPMDITFVVKGEVKTYIGTLRVNGTKEKIRLGGVPIIKPGFEYAADIINESEEAYGVILEKFGCRPEDLELSLMSIQYRSNKDISHKKEVKTTPSAE